MHIDNRPVCDLLYTRPVGTHNGASAENGASAYSSILWRLLILIRMINFSTDDVEMPQLDFDKVKTWIGRVAADHGFIVGKLNYCFCSDTVILDANIKFLGHDYFTDIITFDYTYKNRISGDMLISLDTVRTNAEKVNCAYSSELLRVIIHGVLHLCGINDKGPGEREIMECAENKALSLFEDNSNQ